MMFLSRPALLAAVLSLIAGAALAEMRSVSGVVTYRERIALPPGAVLEVRLVDAGRQDAAARLIARTAVRAGNPPIPYRLQFDSARIDARMRLALQAQIRVRGQLRFISTTSIPYDGEGARVDIVVQQVAARQASAPFGSWLAEDIGGGGVIDRARSEFVLAADGRVSGRGGCNRFAGRATVAGASIAFGGLAATMMACPPAMMDQERRFLAALSAARGWRFDALHGKLTLVDDAGRALATLARQ